MLSGLEILPCIWTRIANYGIMHASRKHKAPGPDKELNQSQHNRQQEYHICISSPYPTQAMWRGLGEYCVHWVCCKAKELGAWRIHLFYANLLFTLEVEKTLPLKIALCRHRPVGGLGNEWSGLSILCWDSQGSWPVVKCYFQGTLMCHINHTTSCHLLSIIVLQTQHMYSV